MTRPVHEPVRPPAPGDRIDDAAALKKFSSAFGKVSPTAAPCVRREETPRDGKVGRRAPRHAPLPCGVQLIENTKPTTRMLTSVYSLSEVVRFFFADRPSIGP